MGTIGLTEKNLKEFTDKFFGHADGMMEIPLIKGIRIDVIFRDGNEINFERFKDDVNVGLGEQNE